MTKTTVTTRASTTAMPPSRLRKAINNPDIAELLLLDQDFGVTFQKRGQ
jgi:hypothetical protein